MCKKQQHLDKRFSYVLYMCHIRVVFGCDMVTNDITLVLLSVTNNPPPPPTHTSPFPPPSPVVPKCLLTG